MVSRNHSDLLNIIGTGLVDNVSGLITAKILRDIATDTVDTIFATTAGSGSLFNVTTDAGLGHLAIQSGSGIRVIGGDGITTTLSEVGDGSGTITIDSEGSGTMSKLMLGYDKTWSGISSVVPLTDSSGIIIKEGHNITVDFEDASGSGIFTINAFPQVFKRISAGGDSGYTWNSHSDLVSDAVSDTLSIVVGTGIRVDTDASNDAIRISVSGNIADAADGSGTMSKLMLGHDSGGSSSVVTLEDASGILLKAGNNISIDFDSNATNGSGIFTFSTTLPSGNAITTVSAGGDTGYTWTSQNDVVAEGDADTLSVVAGTGIRLDTDSTNDAIRFSVSGALPLATHPATSPASSSDNSTNTFIQDITLDAYGHITAIGTNDVTLASASGTMSRLKLGAQDGLEPQQLGDGSGLFFAAGDNMAIELTNNYPSGILTFSSPGSGTMSKFKVMADTAEFPLSLEDGSGLLFAGGTHIDVSLTNENNGSGLLTISADSTLSSGTMSHLHIGASDGPPDGPPLARMGDGSGLFFSAGDNLTVSYTNQAGGSGVITFSAPAAGSGTMSQLKLGSTTMPAGTSQTLTDGSGLFFAAGDNMSVTLTNDAGSGILTFASTLSDLDGLSDVAVSGTTTAAELMLFDNGASGLYIGDQTHSNIAPGDGSNTETHGTVAIGGNTHIGWCAGSGVTTGHHNTLVGSMAGHKLSSAYAYDNTFVGYQAGSGVTGGNAFYHRAENIIIGAHAAVAPDASQFVQNVIIGSDTVRTDGSVMNGNIVIGSNAMEDMVICNNAVAIGLDALSDGTSCTSTIAIGYSAGSNATESTASTFVGSHVGWGVVSGDYSVAFGYKALEYQDRDNTVAIGSYAGGGKSGGGSIEGGVYIGYKAGNESNTLRDHNELFIANETPANEGTLIKGDFSHKLLAVGAADQTLSTGSGTLQVFPKHPTTKALYVKGAAGQTAPLAEFYNGVGDNIVNINAWGVLEASGIAAGPSGLRIDGTAVTATAAELNYVDGVTSNIQTQIDAISGSGTMSKFHIGSTTQVDPNQISLGDGSGLFFAAGDNMTITATNTGGSGVITFASTASGGGTATSGNAFTTISAGGDTGYTWTSQNDIVAVNDADTLKLIAGSGIRLDTDASSKAIRFSASGDYATVESPTFTGTITIGSAEISETELEILDGATLSTTELNYVDGVTSDIQTQLDALHHESHAASGSDGRVQYNNAGHLAGASGLYYDDQNNRVGVSNIYGSVSADFPLSTLDVVGSGYAFTSEFSNKPMSRPALPGVSNVLNPVLFIRNFDSALASNQNNGKGGFICPTHSTHGLMISTLASAGYISIGPSGSADTLSISTEQATVNGDATVTGEVTASRLVVTALAGNTGGVPHIDSDGIIYGSGISAGPSGLRIDGTAITASAAELNYVDGVSSNIQTQIDAISGTGTMSKLHLGATTMSEGTKESLTDGSGLFFAAGDNVTVTLTNDTAGSGVVTIASSHPSISAASTSDNGGNTFIQDITLDGNGHVTGIGTNTIPSGNYATTASPTFTGVVTTPRLVVTALAGNTGGVPHIDSDGIIYGSGISAGPSGLRINGTAITASAAELNYVDGVSSAIQTQMDAKAAVASPTFTGVVTTPRLVVTALAGNTGGVPHIDSDGIIYGSGISAGPSGLRINGVAVTSTAAELNIMDGGATVTTPTVAGADAFVMNDGGTMAQVDIDNVDTYLSATTKTLTNKTLTSPTITSPTITGTTNLASGVIIGVPSTESSDGYSLEVAGQIRASGVVVAPITASDAATVTFDLKQSNFHMLTLARASTTLVFADAKPGQRFLTRLTQDGTGSRNVVWPGGISWARAAGVGTPPPPSATAAHSSMYGFVCTSGVGATMYYDGFIIGSGIQGTST